MGRPVPGRDARIISVHFFFFNLPALPLLWNVITIHHFKLNFSVTVIPQPARNLHVYPHQSDRKSANHWFSLVCLPCHEYNNWWEKCFVFRVLIVSTRIMLVQDSFDKTCGRNGVNRFSIEIKNPSHPPRPFFLQIKLKNTLYPFFLDWLHKSIRLELFSPKQN